jgi:hypothetical protein
MTARAAAAGSVPGYGLKKKRFEVMPFASVFYAEMPSGYGLHRGEHLGQVMSYHRPSSWLIRTSPSIPPDSQRCTSDDRTNLKTNEQFLSFTKSAMSAGVDLIQDLKLAR